LRKQKSNYLSMGNSESTLQEPLKFFQSMFIENGFQLFKASFFYRYEEYPDVVFDGDKIKYWTVVGDANDNPIEVDVIIDFSKEFESLLLIEQGKFIQSMNKAIDAIVYKDKSPEPFLSRLHNKTVKILSASKSEHLMNIPRMPKTIKYPPINKDYPFVEGIINRMKQEIEKELQYYTKESSSISCNTEKELSPQIQTSMAIPEESPRDKLIMEIFGFLNDGKYISNKDWEYLIAYLKSFVIEYNVPQIDKIFDLQRKHRPLIKFLFYVLFEKLQDTRGYQDRFCEFYIKAFETSAPTEKEIKKRAKKMTQKPTKIPDNLPEIVKKIL